MALSMVVGGLSIGAPSVAAFTGHGCTKATCHYFTSSYYTTKFYYNRSTCGEWKSLSTKYLQGFKTSSALLADYPDRKLHKRC
jgi:hypothetical protein